LHFYDPFDVMMRLVDTWEKMCEEYETFEMALGCTTDWLVHQVGRSKKHAYGYKTTTHIWDTVIL